MAVLPTPGRPLRMTSIADECNRTSPVQPTRGRHVANWFADADVDSLPRCLRREDPSGALRTCIHSRGGTPGCLPDRCRDRWAHDLLYFATEPWTDGFRSFLQGQVILLKAAPNWTLRIVFPRPLDRVYDAYQAVVREELESPLQPATISELKWYFEHRDQATREPAHPQTQGFLNVGANVFGTPRFTEMYRRWQTHGNVVFEGPSSPVISEALSTGRGRVESLVLTHAYRHLSPLVDQPGSARHKVEKGVEKGAAMGDIASARPQPPRSTPWSPCDRSVLM